MLGNCSIANIFAVVCLIYQTILGSSVVESGERNFFYFAGGGTAWETPGWKIALFNYRQTRKGKLLGYVSVQQCSRLTNVTCSVCSCLFSIICIDSRRSVQKSFSIHLVEHGVWRRGPRINCTAILPPPPSSPVPAFGIVSLVSVPDRKFVRKLPLFH